MRATISIRFGTTVTSISPEAAVSQILYTYSNRARPTGHIHTRSIMIPMATTVPPGDADVAIEEIVTGEVDNGNLTMCKHLKAFVAEMTPWSQEVWQRLKPRRDCTVTTSDGIVFRAHKCVLSEHSAVLGCVMLPQVEMHVVLKCVCVCACVCALMRYCECAKYVVSDAKHFSMCRTMINELESDTSLTDDSSAFAMLLDALLAKGVKQPPICADNVKVFSELARKYEIGNLHTFCDIFVSQLQLSRDNIAQWYAMADEYGLQQAKSKCRKFVANGNFSSLKRLLSRPCNLLEAFMTNIT